ncbi:MAG: PAS domain S-box protein [Candidatus Omnitrophica bacterium]|nr:PAS domain S-box protein [Candidatus Omnitrophota bacterium]
MKDNYQRFELYVQAIPDIIYELDAQGTFIFVNDSVEQLGYRPEELIGQNFTKIVHPDDIEKVSRSFVLPKYRGKVTGDKNAPKLFDERRTSDRMTKNLEARLLSKSKKDVSIGCWYAEIHSFGRWDKDVSSENKALLGSVGIIRNVTERKLAEEMLKKTHQMLYDILERSPFGIYLVNKEGGIEYVNPAMINISGCNHEEFTSQNVFKSSGYKKADLTDKIKFALEGAVFFLGPVEYVWDGSNKSIVGNFTGIPLEEEGKFKVIIFVEDITELKTTQMQLIQAKKMEVVGGLASGVAHEVKNPLSTILYGVEYLRKKIRSEDEKIALTLKHIKEAVRRADNIIRELLDFSSLPKLDSQKEDLNMVIDKALSLTKHQFDKQHIEVIKDFEAALSSVKIDRNRIEQVLVNLVLNAIESMPKGGQLRLRTYNKKLTELDEGIGFRREDVFKLGEKVVVAEIEDTGPGIPENILDKIFDPFFTTKRNIGGTGLGLSIVMNIIKLHDGRIDIRNKKEGGVIVRLMFKI